jgi:hypothetical protein
MFRALRLCLERHDIVKSVIKVGDLNPRLPIRVVVCRQRAVHEFQVSCVQVDHMLILLLLLLLIDGWYDDVLPALRRAHLTFKLDAQG